MDLLKVGITYRSRLLDQDGNLLSEQVAKNVFVIEGMNYMLGAALGPLAKINAFYLGIFEGNYTPQGTDTAALFPAAATESTAYSESTRQLFVPETISNGTIDNVGNEASFTFTAVKTIYGAFCSSGSSKGSTLGTLISAAKFASPQIAAVGNVLKLQAGCQLVNI